MAKQNISGDKRIEPMERILRQMGAKKGYDLDTAFKGLLDYLLWMFDPDGQTPDGWRFDSDDAKMFYDASRAYFVMIDEELKSGTQWYDAFGDLYMALHPGGGGKAQFFTPYSLCQLTAEACMGGMDITEAQGCSTPFGHRVCINDPAAGSSRLLLAGANIFKRMQHDELGYNEIQQATHRPYLIAEDLDFNCAKMSAINMCVHGCFGEAVCHDSLCNPEGVNVGYIVNEAMWPFPTNVPSIRRYTSPDRFVCTTQMKRRRLALEAQDREQATDRTNAQAVLPLGGGEQSQECGTDFTPVPHSDPVPQTKKPQPQQLTLW